MLTDIDGVRVGSWTDQGAQTGCTVALFPEGMVASGEVRGGAPASRETALLEPSRLVSRIDAVMLCGGSAFGLAACDGAMRFCEERGMGVPTPGGPVPIVVGLGLFDLAVGDSTIRPGTEQGYAACEAASAGQVELGRVGAGTGATVGDGSSGRAPGGLASVTARSGELMVSALLVVNAFGIPGGSDTAALDQTDSGASTLFTNTTIGVIATNASLTKLDCYLVAQSAHDGLARAVFPAHTRFDGDAFVAAATGVLDSGSSSVDAVRSLTTHAVAKAVGAFGEAPGAK